MLDYCYWRRRGGVNIGKIILHALRSVLLKSYSVVYIWYVNCLISSLVDMVQYYGIVFHCWRVGSRHITVLGVVFGERHAPRALKTTRCRFRNGVYAIESLDFKQFANWLLELRNTNTIPHMTTYNLSLYQQRVVTNVLFKIIFLAICSYYLFLFNTFISNRWAILWGDIK
jgi:hypothetical protein